MYPYPVFCHDNSLNKELLNSAEKVYIQPLGRFSCCSRL